jgi:hypothetical protein
VGVEDVFQSMGLIHDIPTCKELLDRIVAEAVHVIHKNFYTRSECIIFQGFAAGASVTCKV